MKKILFAALAILAAVAGFVTMRRYFYGSGGEA